ncbi:MAG TPA: helix-turn-helix domain-containing protein [Dehalococcoidia bacterium]|nr:helix-turn-helix domain-containing protein [Dehalococcoidia bacterium]
MTTTSSLFDPKLALDEDNHYCSMRATLALLGQKWVPRIIYELMRGKRRFNELACVVGGCNSRTLRDRLKGLEELEIIERNVIAVMPPWVEYALTDKGRQLGNALGQLEKWGRSHMADPIV